METQFNTWLFNFKGQLVFNIIIFNTQYTPDNYVHHVQVCHGQESNTFKIKSQCSKMNLPSTEYTS